METNTDPSTKLPALPQPSTVSPTALQSFIAARYPLVISVVAWISLGIWHLVIFKWIALAALALQIVIRRRNKYRNSLTPAAQLQTAEDALKLRTQQLKRGLSKTQFEARTEKPANQALEQLQQNQERMKSFERTLSLKLDPGELTYGRYHEAAQQVHFAVLDQINDIATRLANVVSITDGRESSEGSEGSDSENVTRAELRERELQKVDELLKLNESALTRMDQLTHAISEMKTQNSTASSDLGPLLLELEELAQRAKKY